MHYALTLPIRGCTYFCLREVAYTSVEIVCAVYLGSLENGEFVPDPLFHPIRRSIQQGEREAFLLHAAGQGAPLGEWRDDDLAAWLNMVGLLGS